MCKTISIDALYSLISENIPLKIRLRIGQRLEENYKKFGNLGINQKCGKIFR